MGSPSLLARPEGKGAILSNSYEVERRKENASSHSLLSEKEREKSYPFLLSNVLMEEGQVYLVLVKERNLIIFSRREK